MKIQELQKQLAMDKEEDQKLQVYFVSAVRKDFL
jgi:hypothetical protein